VSWFAPELDPLLAVVAATLDENGTLIEANAGFLRLIKTEGRQPIGLSAARFFQQPDFTALVGLPAGADREIHRGLLTIGDYMGQTRTMHARIWRTNGQLRVLAEYDIDELERLYATVLELNRDYANAQLELAQTNLKLQQREAQITAISLTDPLTGVGNRRRLEESMAKEISRAERTGGKLCAVMADLDHFKRVNDVHGHESGDKLLVALGALLRQQMRPTDIVTRYGGEEFVLLLPHTDLEHALATAERIRTALACYLIEPLHNPVTASFGVAELATGEQGDALLRRADKALYQAKQSGRNRVVAG
jgi:diguanylate cyclase (GGDEF)-like protein